MPAESLKPAAPSGHDLQTKLTIAIGATLKAKQDLTNAEELVATRRARVTNREADELAARNLLGKVKLSEAIDLIKKVGTEAPAGSAASNDIDALAHHLMQRNVQRVFVGMPYESIFAKPLRPGDIGVVSASVAKGKSQFMDFVLHDTVTGRFGTSPQVCSSILKSSTLDAISRMTTAVGAGQPRQAKASPVPPVELQVGDKVRLVKPWFDAANKYLGKELTINKVSVTPHGTYYYFDEFPSGSNCDSKKGNVEFVSRPNKCGYPVCACNLYGEVTA